ncbi:MAG: M20/M25/M40 family metallo-hydrolase [Chromatiales bacterium]|nr:M20/M25/M40 family metallo-hydrolase [Chromatiales bacterium]
MIENPRRFAPGLLLLAATTAFAEPSPVFIDNVRQLTFEGKRAGEGYFSADGTLMVFQSERDPANPFYRIFLMDLETGDVEPISPGIGKTTCAWVHPGNDKVLYASTHEDPQARDKMQAELDFRAAGKQRRYSWDYDPAFDLFVHDRATGQDVNLTHTRGYDAEGAYSPDGSQIVFASNRLAYSSEMSEQEAKRFEHDPAYMMDLYLMDADGSNLKRLTSAPGYDGGPFFSADGGRIVWRRFSPDGARAEIYTMDLATGEEKALTHMGVMSWAPYFHPSGEYVIFASNREGFANFELFMVDAQGRHEPVRVTDAAGFDGLPVFTPDGQHLAWTSNRGAKKQSQIYWGDWNHAAALAALNLDQRGETLPDVSLETTDQAIRAEDVRMHVERLAADDMQGRLTGSAGARLATGYVARVFEQLGLQPAGDDGGWFQRFPFTAGVELDDGNALAIGGVDSAGEPQVNRDWRPLALSRNGRVEPAAVVFAGYGIDAPGLGEVPDYDAYQGLDVKGKWVVVLRFQPDNVPPAWRRHFVHYSDLANKASVAKRHGAIGMIVVTGPKARSRDRLVELKLDGTSPSSHFSALSISDELAEKLLASAGKDLETLQTELDKGEPVPGFELPEVSVSAELHLKRQKRQGRNVLAVLKAENGQGKPPVIIGAHVDHLGHGEVSGSMATDEERGLIHHGADDNASGVAALLEVAQYLKDLANRGKLKPRRDILFAAWSGEELGTLGSQHFVDTYGDKSYLRGKVSAYLNMDMVGHLREQLYLQGTGSSSAWAREIERRNVPVGLPITTKDDPYLPTDSTPFYMKGVPILHAFTGAHEDYSTPRDTADKLNYEGIRDIARLMAGIVRSIARSDEDPDYLAVARKKGGLSRTHLRAYLGTIPAYGQEEGLRGVKLQGAVKDGPAEKAGVQAGDVVIALAGVDVETIQDFMTALSGLKVGEATEMTVLRADQTVRLRVVPGARE